MTNLPLLYRIAEQDGIEVDCYDLHKRDALSYLDDDGLCYIAINPLMLASGIDEKTKLAHELGHCETGSFYNQYTPHDVRQKHENRADKWAIKKLVPKDELQEAVSAGYTQVWELAELFDVTEDFMRKAINWHERGTLAVN